MWTQPPTNNTTEKGWWRPSPTPNFIYQSIYTGTFSNILKQALLCPLLNKVNLDHNFKNYRLVSNLSFISKLLERIMGSQLVHYATSTGNIESLQSATPKTIQVKQHYSKWKLASWMQCHARSVSCFWYGQSLTTAEQVTIPLWDKQISSVMDKILPWRLYPTSCHWWSWQITGEVN